MLITPNPCLDIVSCDLLILPWKAYKALQNIKINESPDPDQVPNVVWKEFAFELSSVICDLYNSPERGVLTRNTKGVNCASSHKGSNLVMLCLHL